MPEERRGFIIYSTRERYELRNRVDAKLQEIIYQQAKKNVQDKLNEMQDYGIF